MIMEAVEGDLVNVRHVQLLQEVGESRRETCMGEDVGVSAKAIDHGLYVGTDAVHDVYKEVHGHVTIPVVNFVKEQLGVVANN